MRWADGIMIELMESNDFVLASVQCCGQCVAELSRISGSIRIYSQNSHLLWSCCTNSTFTQDQYSRQLELLIRHNYKWAMTYRVIMYYLLSIYSIKILNCYLIFSTKSLGMFQCKSLSFKMHSKYTLFA